MGDTEMSVTVTTDLAEVEHASPATEAVLAATPRPDHVPAELRLALREQQQTLVARLVTVDGTASTTSYLPGHEERITARLAGIRRLLEETDSAFSRIDDGTYGSCRGCAERISFVRLEILPHTRYCLPCQQRQDAQRR
jgi:DnaK suppressor protein